MKTRIPRIAAVAAACLLAAGLNWMARARTPGKAKA